MADEVQNINKNGPKNNECEEVVKSKNQDCDTDKAIIDLIESEKTNKCVETLSDDDIDKFEEVSEKTIGEYNALAVQQSEKAYIEIVRGVVEKSSASLTALREDKKNLRDSFVGLFKVLIMAQLIALAIVIIVKGFVPCFRISDNIVLTFMTTVFVETIGVIALMIAFAFTSKEEIEIINILNSVVENYQKYNNIRQKDKTPK